MTLTKKRRVLLTGGSGSMGSEAFKELLRRRDRYDISLLLRPQRGRRKAYAKYENMEGVKIVWGDIREKSDVEEAVAGADHVLHVAALIPPMADKLPKTCVRTNYDGTQNLLAAIKRRTEAGDDVSFVYISSVAIYGDRLPPYHMLRVGDPIRPSIGDVYATTKANSERAVIESGLRRWAILRQTYIAIPNALTLLDPILFHQPLDTRIELITNQDAGYGVVQTLEAPDGFYRRVYNMSGGPKCRVVYSDYLERMMHIFGCGDYRKLFQRNWFASRNFHCGWFADGDVLNNYLGHWRQTLDDHYAQVTDNIPFSLKVGTRIGPKFLMRAYLRRIADPLKWIERGDVENVKAFFGSRSAWERIPGWDTPPDGENLETSLKKREENYREDFQKTIEGMEMLAATRGGRCNSNEYVDDAVPLKWSCGRNHRWTASPALVRAGHWCPECAPPPWDYDAVAKVDPLIAQYHYANHSPEESQTVTRLYESEE
ncbi:MAG: NAD-dependent epimerase/dehydratase family protein [Halobacteriota archaeon]